MNIKTNLFEEYVNFVDNTKKQKKNYGYLQLYLYIILLIILTIIKFRNKIN